jgi:predicted RecA/RadA family phage recombinase
MLTTFIHEGDAVDYTAGADVAAGDVVVQSDLVGVAKTPIAANVSGALAVTGVFDFPKATGDGTAIAAGATVYWDVADSEAKTDAEAGANKLIGKTVKAAADDDATVRVRLRRLEPRQRNAVLDRQLQLGRRWRRPRHHQLR